MGKDYPGYFEQLQNRMGLVGQELPGVMSGFGQLHKASIEGGALSTKTKELIALAIAITVRCDGCISFHVHDALKSGVTREEILEAIGVAILMGGGPAVVYGCEALEALEQFEKAGIS
ncbi:MAG: carboxymuconolactone decarboxylase family protein [Desulfuromonadales bacterium]|nr:carboxymuconolactone decarboxylase family protein [Desulfuromonadales bacterium]MBN2791691.1 carboxymuconolactone decarboxylase family protein [Desulfuromonadales bacterium]